MARGIPRPEKADQAAWIARREPVKTLKDIRLVKPLPPREAGEAFVAAAASHMFRRMEETGSLVRHTSSEGYFWEGRPMTLDDLNHVIDSKATAMKWWLADIYNAIDDVEDDEKAGRALHAAGYIIRTVFRDGESNGRLQANAPVEQAAQDRPPEQSQHAPGANRDVAQGGAADLVGEARAVPQEPSASEDVPRALG